MNNLDLEVIIQNNSLSDYIPSIKKISSWLGHIPDRMIDKYVTIRIVDELESKDINLRYRKIDRATNVLAFPSGNMALVEIEEALPLGDLVICAPLLEKEAISENKTLDSHWAHILIHGILHLIGYDHEQPLKADIMEDLESRILLEIGFDDPYS
ncbi:MAG: rRNA maturation RNase YbeY [Gammaproteobacteria bacterium TMED78]|nr:MAG: rRNA maturation RNase YbeY [Gammaproteobacteria bacterium TMED78]|tara:strand:+ start:465 stop:929 length:465 start_codon:yes stop_codon:yes gene_type:complete